MVDRLGLAVLLGYLRVSVPRMEEGTEGGTACRPTGGGDGEVR